MGEARATDFEEHLSPLAFAPTLDRLAAAIAAAGVAVFARVDHQAGARAAGLQMRPSTVLIYGHPTGGTPVMQAVPEAALDLPLRVLVREREDGEVVIAFHPVAAMLQRVGVPVEIASRLEPLQRLLVAALAP
ncbi:MAG: DUF302 domain-containing protein [Acetobacteraceae bacterium]